MLQVCMYVQMEELVSAEVLWRTLTSKNLTGHEKTKERAYCVLFHTLAYRAEQNPIITYTQPNYFYSYI